MQSTVVLFFALFGVPALVQQSDTAAVESPWQTYGYIAFGAVVVAIIVIVLIRKQHRKFNE